MVVIYIALTRGRAEFDVQTERFGPRLRVAAPNASFQPHIVNF